MSPFQFTHLPNFLQYFPPARSSFSASRSNPQRRHTTPSWTQAPSYWSERRVSNLSSGIFHSSRASSWHLLSLAFCPSRWKSQRDKRSVTSFRTARILTGPEFPFGVNVRLWCGWDGLCDSAFKPTINLHLSLHKGLYAAQIRETDRLSSQTSWLKLNKLPRINSSDAFTIKAAFEFPFLFSTKQKNALLFCSFRFLLMASLLMTCLLHAYYMLITCFLWKSLI